MYGPRSKAAHKALRLIEDVRRPTCTLCPLHRSSVNVCVMGNGNPNGELMLVGEAPGEKEAETCEPFRGRAGTEVLRPILDEIGAASRTYITNVCKCRPPKNRKPTADEMETCAGVYLRQEIAIVQPRVVVLLGTTPSELFYGSDDSYKRKRGTLERVTYPTRYWPYVASHLVMPTWHPAYCLPGRGGKFFARELAKHLAIAYDASRAG